MSLRSDSNPFVRLDQFVQQHTEVNDNGKLKISDSEAESIKTIFEKELSLIQSDNSKDIEDRTVVNLKELQQEREIFSDLIKRYKSVMRFLNSGAGQAFIKKIGKDPADIEWNLKFKFKRARERALIDHAFIHLLQKDMNALNAFNNLPKEGQKTLVSSVITLLEQGVFKPSDDVFSEVLSTACRFIAVREEVLESTLVRALYLHVLKRSDISELILEGLKEPRNELLLDLETDALNAVGRSYELSQTIDPKVLDELKQKIEQFITFFKEEREVSSRKISDRDAFQTVSKTYRDDRDYYEKVKQLGIFSKANYHTMMKLRCPEVQKKVVDMALSWPKTYRSVFVYLICGSSESVYIEKPNLEGLEPLLNWISTEVNQSGKTDEIRSTMEKCVAIILKRPEIAAFLSDIPADKVHLWHEVLRTCSDVSKLTIRNIAKVLKDKEIDTIIEKHYSDPKIVEKMQEVLDRNTKYTPALLKWIALVQGKESLDSNVPLKEHFEELNEEQQKIVEEVVDLLKKYPFIEKSLFTVLRKTPLLLQTFCQWISTGFSNKSFYDGEGKKCQELMDKVINFPEKDLPKILEMLKNEGIWSYRIENLMDIRKVLNDENWSFFLENHHDDKSWHRLAGKLSGNHNKAALQALIGFERDERIRSTQAVDYFCDNELLWKELQKDTNFRKDFFHTMTQMGLPPKILKNYSRYSSEYPLYKHNLSLVKKIYKIAAGHRLSKDILIKEVAEPNIVPSDSAPLHQLLEPFTEKPKVLEQLLNLLDYGETELVRDLTFILANDEPLGKRLVDFSKLDQISALKELIRLKKESGNDPLVVNLLKVANSENASLVSRCLKLKKEGKYAHILNKIKMEGLNPLNRNLIAAINLGSPLFLNGVNELVGKGDDHWVFSLIERGDILLAQKLWKKEGSYWEKIQNMNHPETQDQLSDIMEVVEFQNSKKKIGDFCLALTTSKVSNELVNETLASVQFLMKNHESSLIGMIDLNDVEGAAQVIRKALSEGSLSLENFLKQQLATHRSLIQSEPSLSTGKVTEEWKCTKKDISLVLANCLLTTSGGINFGLITKLIDSDTLSEIEATPYTKTHLKHVLHILEKNPEFGQRLQQAVVPTKGSQAYEMIRVFLNIDGQTTVTTEHVQQVILSALICPTRQGGVGSCFGTARVIMQEQTKWGLRQVLEDHLDLTAASSMYRVTAASGGISVRTAYPMFGAELVKSKTFEHDHPLNRAREFTIASLGSGTNDLLNNLCESLLTDWVKPVLSRQFVEFLSIPSSVLFEVHGHFKKVYEEVLRKNTGTLFLAHAKDPNPPHTMGAWTLSDKTKNDRPFEKLEEFQEFLGRILKESLESIRSSFPDHASEITEAILGKEGLFNYINSYEFGRSLLESGSILSSVSPYVHQTTAKKKLWVSYGVGGNLFSVDSVYFEESKTSGTEILPHSYSNLLNKVIQFVEFLPKSIKTASFTNHELAIPFIFPGHQLSLKPYIILKLLEEGKTAKGIIQQLNTDAKQWFEAPMPNGSLEAILKALSENEFVVKNSALQKILTQPTVLQAKSLKELSEALNAEAVRVGLDEKTLDLFLKKLGILVGKEKLMIAQNPQPALIFCDTNWSSRISRLGIGASASTGKLTVQVTDHAGIKVTTPPWNLINDSWSMDPVIHQANGYNLIRASR